MQSPTIALMCVVMAVKFTSLTIKGKCTMRCRWGVSVFSALFLLAAMMASAADIETPQNASAGSSMMVAEPAWIRARLAAVSGSMRSMKKRPVTSLVER